MKTFLKYSEFINEASDEDDKVKTHIDKLVDDPKIQDAMGTSDKEKLRHAFLVLYKRGYGAAKTNWGAVRPQIKALGRPAAYIAWGYSRLNAFIEKRNAYKTSDSDAADWLKGKGDKPTEKPKPEKD